MTELLLIRHGETEWNVIGRYQGQADPPLNETGLEQAHQLADKLADSGLQVLYSSPLRRAAQTAEILSWRLQVPVHYDQRLVEIHQGDWQERLRADIQDRYPELFSRWETEPWSVTPPGGEHLTAVQKRVYAAVADIIKTHNRERVGLVSHRIPIALVKLKYQGLDPDIVRTLHLPNTYYELLRINPQLGTTEGRISRS
jgi:broad specificity phosphatase PhoE